VTHSRRSLSICFYMVTVSSRTARYNQRVKARESIRPANNDSGMVASVIRFIKKEKEWFKKNCAEYMCTFNISMYMIYAYINAVKPYLGKVIMPQGAMKESEILFQTLYMPSVWDAAYTISCSLFFVWFVQVTHNLTISVVNSQNLNISKVKRNDVVNSSSTVFFALVALCLAIKGSHSSLTSHFNGNSFLNKTDGFNFFAKSSFLISIVAPISTLLYYMITCKSLDTLRKTTFVECIFPLTVYVFHSSSSIYLNAIYQLSLLVIYISKMAQTMNIIGITVVMPILKISLLAFIISLNTKVAMEIYNDKVNFIDNLLDYTPFSISLLSLTAISISAIMCSRISKSKNSLKNTKKK